MSTVSSAGLQFTVVYANTNFKGITTLIGLSLNEDWWHNHLLTLNQEEERKLQYFRHSCWKTIVSGTKFWGVSLCQLNSIAIFNFDFCWAFFGYHFRQITFKTRSIEGFKYLFACNDNLSWYFNFKLKISNTKQTFCACRFYFPNTDNVTMPRRVSSFKVRHFHACTLSQNLLGIGTWSVFGKQNRQAKKVCWRPL